MVSYLDNDQVNTRYRSDFSSKSPGEHLIDILNRHEELLHRILADQIDVDIYGSDSGATGIITLKNPQRSPMLITDVIASWNTPSTTTVGWVLNQIPLGANAVASYNNNPVGVQQTISGGTVTVIAINGTTTGLTSGTFFVPAGGTVTVTYSVAPTTFTTAAIPGIPMPSSTTTNPTTVTIKIKDRTYYGVPADNGLFVLTGIHGLQIDINETFSLTTTPAVACTFEVLGKADYRKLDRL